MLEHVCGQFFNRGFSHASRNSNHSAIKSKAIVIGQVHQRVACVGNNQRGNVHAVQAVPPFNDNGGGTVRKRIVDICMAVGMFPMDGDKDITFLNGSCINGKTGYRYIRLVQPSAIRPTC